MICKMGLKFRLIEYLIISARLELAHIEMRSATSRISQRAVAGVSRFATSFLT